MRFLATATGILAFSSSAALAQDGGDEEDPISGKAAVGYLATNGNTESTNANASFELLYGRDVWSHEYELSAVTASNEGETTTEAYTFAYGGRREFGEVSYLFTALDWERDEFSAFDSQVSETVGYGRHLVATDAHALDFEIGGGARQSEQRDGTSLDDSIVRAALDYVWTVNDATSFSQQFLVASGSTNTRSQSVSELRARLFGNVALVLSYRIKHNSDVESGIEKADSFSAISLEYAF